MGNGHILGGVHRIRGLVVLLGLLALTVPAVAYGDSATRGRILVPGDHFLPGETLSITGADLDEGVEVVLRLTAGSTTAELGRALVNMDGTLAASAAVPLSFPLGYAELTATSPTETVWSAVILIGERAEGPRPASPSVPGNVLPIAILAVGIVIFVAAGVRSLRR